MESTTPTNAPEKPERRLSKAGRAAAFIGAGALGATVLTGVASAAGDNNSASPNPSASSAAPQQGQINGGGMGDRDGDHGPGGRGGHGRGDFGMGAGPGSQLLHSEAVVKDANGKVQTVRTVEGTVTAVTGDSITVKASDGFTQTFAVNASTTYHRPPANLGQNQGQRPDPSKDTGKLSDIKVGDVADVTGTVSGSTVTATHVRSMTAAQAKQFEQMRKQHEAQEQQERQQNQQSNPSSSASPSA